MIVVEDIEKKIESIVNDAEIIFNRQGTRHAPRPVGIKIVGHAQADRLLEAFNKVGNIEVVREETCSLCDCSRYQGYQRNGWYVINTDLLF